MKFYGIHDMSMENMFGFENNHKVDFIIAIEGNKAYTFFSYTDMAEAEYAECVKIINGNDSDSEVVSTWNDECTARREAWGK